jgi:hypothetical protein
MEVAAKVLEETKRFQADLPELMKKFRDLWVLYKDGRVEASFQSEDEAFKAGLEAFGLDGGHIVIRVEPMEPVPLTAGIMFGLA